jgi:hypothetical protein
MNVHRITGQLAAVVASTDAVPRLVRQVASLFLVTPRGDVWRVFDSEDSSGTSRLSPSANPAVVSRVFIGSGSEPAVRIHVFREGESRSIAADWLHDQLMAAKPGH